jgi:NMD protein affecting ribosome stability and mRNA decay
MKRKIMGSIETRSHTKKHRDRQFKEVGHDPYMVRDKPEGTLLCPKCRLVYRTGRWLRLQSRPTQAKPHLCPACHRISDKFPAGYVKLSGEFTAAKRAELLKLVQNEATRASNRHPLQRIMGIEDEPDGAVTVTTTDVHLARRIGEALHHAFQGNLEVKYSPDQYLVRVDWSREG